MNPDSEIKRSRAGFNSLLIVALTCFALIALGAPSFKEKISTPSYADAVFLSAIEVNGERYGVFEHHDVLAFVNSRSETTWQDRTSKVLWLGDECFLPELGAEGKQIDLVKCKKLPLAAKASSDRVVLRGSCYSLTSDSSTGEMHFLQCA